MKIFLFFQLLLLFFTSAIFAQPLDSTAHDGKINVNLDTLAYSFAEGQAPDTNKSLAIPNYNIIFAYTHQGSYSPNEISYPRELLTRISVILLDSL